MVYAFTMDVPINGEAYDRIIAELGEDPPHGLLCHMAVEHEGKLRYIDIWESREEWERFQDECLHPVVDEVLAAAGFTTRPPEPEQHELQVRHHWGAYQKVGV